MPELRKDPIIDRWVINATERARRPGNIIDRSNEALSDAEENVSTENFEQDVYSVSKGGSNNWCVRVVRGQNPLFEQNGKFELDADGIYELAPAYGRHEIVLETPSEETNIAHLSIDQIQRVVETYAHRLKDMREDKYLQHGFVFKNYRGFAQTGLSSRSVIIGSAVIPLHMTEEYEGAVDYFRRNQENIYDEIVRQEVNEQRRLVSQTEHFVAVAPFAARFPFELWIIPKEVHCDFSESIQSKEADLSKMLKDVLLRLHIGLDDPGYSFVIHTAPLHRESYDENLEKAYSWHIEITPRLTHVAGFEKGSGFYICPIPPENAAEYLREVEVKP